MTVALQSLPQVSTAIRRRRRLQLARTVVGHSVRTRLLPAGERRRQRLEVCGAADTLTALGVRVQVIPSPIPWPRSGRFVISDHVGRLGDLAVATAFRGTTRDGSVICPVSVRYRVQGRAGYLPAHAVPRRTAAIAAMHGLVVEVLCLPAVRDPLPA
ncbi:hypothetical protein [Blastococcus sp. CT_GayMR16]|uniref:hypothetical protein n=1 Tax=Blastococcus sp. CT_GayMR16 TaxID=2559607 RepID=UPI00107456D3|nr:hypothetical protein [Blastococcus sp. CT_GayMR16]TFV87237.1 hypothetical protein E4P38_14925 [Blastococcus sp. CT_GayMR16]